MNYRFLFGAEQSRFKMADQKIKCFLQSTTFTSTNKKLSAYENQYRKLIQVLDIPGFHYIKLDETLFLTDCQNWVLGEASEYPAITTLMDAICDLREDIELHSLNVDTTSDDFKCALSREAVAQLFMFLMQHKVINPKMSNKDLAQVVSGLTRYNAEKIRQDLSLAESSKTETALYELAKKLGKHRS